MKIIRYNLVTYYQKIKATDFIQFLKLIQNKLELDGININDKIGSFIVEDKVVLLDNDNNWLQTTYKFKFNFNMNNRILITLRKEKIYNVFTQTNTINNELACIKENIQITFLNMILEHSFIGTKVTFDDLDTFLNDLVTRLKCQNKKCKKYKKEVNRNDNREN